MNYLLTHGFITIQSDFFLFILHNSGISTYGLVYVDDIIVTGNQAQEAHSIICTLFSNLLYRSWPVTLFSWCGGVDGIFSLGINVSWICCRDVDIIYCKGVPTPATSTVDFSSSFEDNFVDASLYKRIIGSLHYLSFTQPDISFAVNKLSQFMHLPTNHWCATKRLLRYLQHTSNFGIKIIEKITTNSLHILILIGLANPLIEPLPLAS
ncbi:Retrovirus-related Pol polyprotein from transposon TNT 1-94 [Gossypium australe]|uniref:Retrovirus-related Pol polyprotein from transposon TNT 1-94 n=1 Tax=Gossypium australe TaxID=47621 RepID=A0A5B6V615_9ROSI|nr:Retrovirus-related Pol polyprotein from transposon TNT 1-94 [Gossypium australe]